MHILCGTVEPKGQKVSVVMIHITCQQRLMNGIKINPDLTKQLVWLLIYCDVI